MYKKIYVPVDNSDPSNRAVVNAVQLAKHCGAAIVGCHVYAAKMHDYRFKQMEYTLPEEYLEENELNRQRKIHDSLITMGLKLISDCYLEDVRGRCEKEGLAFEPRMMDGKHHVEIARDLQQSDYDLTILGATGIGRVRDSQIGSVCERVVRACARDVWVVKHVPEAEGGTGDESGQAGARDTILVGVDGSPQGFGALTTAIDLAAKFGKQVEAISVYDPYLHYSVFNGIVNVLTEKAAQVFRFEEQNELHEEIIDNGLAQIYQSHLTVAKQMASERGVELKSTLLDGKAFQKILDHARKSEPWLLVIGRIGVHSVEGDQSLGSNAENLLRSCPCDILLTTREERPELDLKAEETIRWTPEAEERMKRVPDMVQGMARTAIYRLAIEQGHSVISSDLLDEAMTRFMPGSSAKKTARLAQALAYEAARERDVSVCTKCGLAAMEPSPEKCSGCGADSFDIVTGEMLSKMAEMEGGLEEETTYDGRTLRWSQDAKRALWTVKDAYLRRRAKARVEKSARTGKLATITLEFARKVIEDETAEPLVLPDRPADGEPAAEEPAEESGLALMARDENNNPLYSRLQWTEEAIGRVFRVPPGFMRTRLQERAERLVGERGLARVELALVEEGIDEGRREMEEFTRSQEAESRSAADEGSGEESPATAVETTAGKCPYHEATEGQTRDGLYLNEIGVLQALEAKRKEKP